MANNWIPLERLIALIYINEVKIDANIGVQGVQTR